MTSRWRTEARALIADAVANALEELPALRNNPGALIGLVSKAYPHKARRGPSWRVWIDELTLARERLELQLGRPFARPCKACGARTGKPCRPTSEHDALIADRQLAAEAAPRHLARQLADAITHAARGAA